jgi:hypothetical protein
MYYFSEPQTTMLPVKKTVPTKTKVLFLVTVLVAAVGLYITVHTQPTTISPLNIVECSPTSKSHAFEILSGRVHAVTLNNFRGTLVWYYCPMTEEMLKDKTELVFAPLQSIPPISFDGTKKTIEVPNGAHAFIRFNDTLAGPDKCQTTFLISPPLAAAEKSN